ncbi:MAG: hypothetical protein ACE5OR_11700, partial [bacterium]
MRFTKSLAVGSVSALVVTIVAYAFLDKPGMEQAISKARLEENLIRAQEWDEEVQVFEEEPKDPEIERKHNDPGFRMDLHLQYLARLRSEGKGSEEIDTFLNGPGLEALSQNQGRISARVYLADEVSVPDYAIVTAFDIRGYPVATGFASAGGSYVLDGLRAGRYYVRVLSSHGLQYYNGASDWRKATLVQITQEGEAEHIDFLLNSAGAISGAVMDNTGAPLGYIDLNAVDPRTGYSQGWGYSDEEGDYIISGLEPGAYLVRALGYGDYVTKYYNNVTHHSVATPVRVSEADTTAGIYFMLEPGARIEGTITDTSGGSVHGVKVYAIDPVTAESFGAAGVYDGEYSLGGLPSGKYLVRTSSGKYQDMYYKNTTDFSQATPIVVHAPYSKYGIDFVLPMKGGAIAGNVKDRFGSPVYPISISALDPLTGKRKKSSSTDKNGDYLIEGLATGSYAVKVYSSEHVNEYYDDAHSLAEATPVTVTAPFVTDGIDFTLEDLYGSIAGTIQDESGHPIESIHIRAVDPNTGELKGIAYSDWDGDYRMHLPDGRYVVWTDANWLGFVNEYYDDVLDFDEATPIEVIRPNITENIDFALEMGGAIAGRVVDEAGEPVRYVEILALDSETGELRGRSYTKYDYTIGGLPSGQYVIFVEGSHLGYVNMYYDNVAHFSEATAVTVNRPDTTFGVNFVLPKGGVITGQVLEQSGEPLPKTIITAFDVKSGELVSSDGTDEDGRYAAGGLATGGYVLRADAHHQGWAVEYYDGVANFSEATVVEVTVSDTTFDINFNLEKGGAISGLVLDQDGIPVYYPRVVVIDPNHSEKIVQGKGYYEGEYTIGGLPSGSYLVKTEMAEWGYADEYYDNAPDVSSATLVEVVAPDTVAGIDFELEITTGYIAGRVTDNEGAAILRAYIHVLDPFTGHEISMRSKSYNEGNYIVPMLSEGTYLVKAEVYTTASRIREWSYIPEYYDNARTFREATPVEVVARDTTKGIDFNLDPILGSISGRATDEDGHPRTSVSVCALSFHSLERQGVGRTDADGTYLISGLPTGTYIVEIPRYRYAGVYFDQAQDVAHATPVEVTAPHKTSGIDFVLGPIGSIAGQLTYGGVPLSKDSGSVFIIAYDAESGAFRGIDFGSSDGNYEIDGLPPGDYKIAALPSICWSEDPCPYTITYYGGGRTFADSTSLRVTVLPDQTVSGIDIEMKSAGGFISGHFYDGSMGGLL